MQNPMSFLKSQKWISLLGNAPNLNIFHYQIVQPIIESENFALYIDTPELVTNSTKEF